MTFTGAAIVAGVTGWPVKHSRSPRIHNYWLAKYAIDGVYVPFAIPPDRLGDALRALPALGIAGLNVTVPHKEAAFRAMDETDAWAGKLGAVNTVVVRPDGSLSGSNTDAFGFLESLREGSGSLRESLREAPGSLRGSVRPGWDAAAGPAAILGAGGAARAIVAGLVEAGAPEIRIVNRTPSRAAALREAFGAAVSAVRWEDRSAALDGAALLVNATTLGMDGQPPLEIDLAPLPADATVCDIVYVPLETPLLAAARARGNPAVDGLGMLLHQARPGFRAWFGTDPEVDRALRDHVLAGL